MHVGVRIRFVAGVAVLLVNVTAAQAQTCSTVSFEDITDAVAGRFFDAAATAASAGEHPTKLVIRFNAGRDPATWKANDFRASTAAFSHLSAMDTISFRIVAPEGCAIAKIAYKQDGSGTVYRTGIVRGASNWVVGDYAADLGTYATNPDLNETIDLTGQYFQVLPVSISTGVHAFTTPLAGSAAVSITGAQVLVELEELPKPVADEPAPAEELPAEEPELPADEPALPAEEPAPVAAEEPAPPVLIG
jgi:hypothetical protein